MAVGRADIHRIAAVREVIRAALTVGDVPLSDGSVQRRTVRLVLNDDGGDESEDEEGALPLDAAYIYKTHARRANKRRPTPKQFDPRLVIDPPLWSYEAPEFLALRRKVSWKHAEDLGALHLVDEVRVVCPQKDHSNPPRGANWAWVNGTKGRIWASGSMAFDGVPTGLRGHEPIPGDLRGIGKRFRCPIHPKAVCEEYPVLHGYARSQPFFSSTSKMSTLSWSLPAGPTQLGGTCPGSNGMSGLALYPAAEGKSKATKTWKGTIQEIIDVMKDDPSEGQVVTNPIVIRSSGAKLRIKGEHTLANLFAREDVAGVALDPKVPITQGIKTDFVCDICYALKGNYANLTTQLGGILRQLWLEHELATVGVDGTAATIAQAIAVALNNVHNRKREGHSLRHFRVHDSADFASPKMVDVWGKVCEALPEVLFWFPTRVWHLKAYHTKLRKWTEHLSNMTIRPSAFRVNAPAPRSGLTKLPFAGSGSGSHVGHESWPCPAYLSREATCANAINPWGWEWILAQPHLRGLDPLQLMILEAEQEDARKVFLEGGEVPSAWLTDVAASKVKPKKPGKGKPIWEEMLERGFPEGIGCRVCWGGLNPGPGPADNRSEGTENLGRLCDMAVIYHEH